MFNKKLPTKELVNVKGKKQALLMRKDTLIQNKKKYQGQIDLINEELRILESELKKLG